VKSTLWSTVPAATLSILVFNFYPVTAVMIVLLALLNDGAILSIAYDRVRYANNPERWNMPLVLGIASVLGLAVSVAILLSLLSLGVLIYFINHLSISLQASYIIATVGADLKQTIENELSEGDSNTSVASPGDIEQVFASATVPIITSILMDLQGEEYVG
jgi:hypothetical protein